MTHATPDTPCKTCGQELPRICSTCGTPLRLVWATVLSGGTKPPEPDPEKRELCFPCFDAERAKSNPKPSRPSFGIWHKPKAKRRRKR